MRARSLCSLLAAALLCACAPRGAATRPSILLVVIDTLRADAVSAYGEAAETTPHLDRLAAEGVLYRHAFAPSPWTLPSHATLFTGRGLAQHGVGLHGSMALPEEALTLAERLRAAGYRTAGFSENPLVGRLFGLAQGFEHYRAPTPEAIIAQGGGPVGFDVLAEIRRWAEGTPDARPAFVFVNLFDPHDPYAVRERNPFLPEGVPAATARSVARGAPGMCELLPTPGELAILGGLYRGEALAADAKLGSLQRQVREAVTGSHLITVVTSDHGEHLGEHGILGHQFSVRNPVLWIPLVVHGRPGVVPAVIEQPVELANVAGSVLAWSGLRGPDDPTPLPEAPAEAQATPTLFASYEDAPLEAPSKVEAAAEGVGVRVRPTEGKRRDGCRPLDRVFGDTHALTRFPFKLIRFAHHPPELYDLSWDPGERSDLAKYRPALVAELLSELDAHVEALDRKPRIPEATPDEAAEALRKLGYVE